MIKFAYKISVLFILFFHFSILTYSQKQNYVGFNFTEEWTSNNNIRHGAGFMFERQITKCSGIETGLYLRTFTKDWVQTINTNDYNIEISEVFCSLPILYKYYSKTLNIAIGPTIDYIIGWYQRNDESSLNITSYAINPKYNYGLLLKLSKQIPITEKLLIEPEIRYNPIFKYSRYYLGIGLAVKYKL